MFRLHPNSHNKGVVNTRCINVMISDEVAEALKRLKERHGLHNLAETIEKIVLSATPQEKEALQKEACRYAVSDQTGRLNCTLGNGHVGFCKSPCPYGKDGENGNVREKR